LILTSNIGSDILVRPDATLADGTVTEEAKEAVLERVRSLYPPELVSPLPPVRLQFLNSTRPSLKLNRLDEQIVFNSLSPRHIAEIVDLRIREVQKALLSVDRRVELLVEQPARDWLGKEGYQPRWGARALNRLINKQVRLSLVVGDRYRRKRPLTCCFSRLPDSSTARVGVVARYDQVRCSPLRPFATGG
jgi:ATP-dependent Clp protease ATP-binding subunit ClpB